MNLRRSLDEVGGLFATDTEPVTARSVLSEDVFHRMISRERKRTERSHRPILLMLLDMGEGMSAYNGDSCLRKILSVLSETSRDTDVVGWYKEALVVGAMFTDFEAGEKKHIVNIVLNRVSSALAENLSSAQFDHLSISFHWFPEEWASGGPKRPSNPVFYPEDSDTRDRRKISSGIKRVMDIVGSIAALILLSPFFLVIAAAIKLTSKGPVFFRQSRLGENGAPFTFLKFRSMVNGNDSSVHQEYVKKLIAGHAERHQSDENSEGVFKLTGDSRITRVGAFLRKTSLDELPQFINVLKGEMSLVGPRPPIPYEVESYAVWHRRRLLVAKPGITGLWQISGRSRVTFDEMVRLDLRYARSCSPWMDTKILLRTPMAVVLGSGAH